MASRSSFDYQAIQNTIATYCIALDTKNYPLLYEVFKEDVETVYPFDGGTCKGLKAISDRISNRNMHVASQHALSTQTIEIAQDGISATATTYFSAIHFGKGKWQSQTYTVWGQYVDHLIRVDTEAALPGASGKWRISRRETSFMGTQGEERLKLGESG